MPTMHTEDFRSFLKTKASLALYLVQKAFQSGNHHITHLQKGIFFSQPELRKQMLCMQISCVHLYC